MRVTSAVLLSAVFACGTHLTGSGHTPVRAATSQAATSQAAISRCATPAMAATADAFAAAFESHQFVFVGSTHGDVKIDEFLMCVVSRPAFTERVTDIVTEWASSGQQRLLDRYLLGLEPLSYDDLAPIWLDTDHPKMWATLPNVRQFLKTVRAVNETLPAPKRIRLIGGNEGIDWTKVRTVEDLAPYPYKTNLMPHLMIEHLAKTPGTRALVVYGDAHIRHNSPNFMADLEAALDRKQLFVVGTIHELRPEERSYVAAIGDPAQPFFVDAGRFPATPSWPQSLRTRVDEDSKRLADYIDALLYLGPEPNQTLTGRVLLTAALQSELARRAAILDGPQRSMRARFQGRDRWFENHPNDMPPRPAPAGAQPR